MADPTETVYTRTGDDGKTLERTAYTAADVVQLEFDGWVKKTGRLAKAAAEAKTSK